MMHYSCKLDENVSNIWQDIVLTMFRDAQWHFVPVHSINLYLHYITFTSFTLHTDARNRTKISAFFDSDPPLPDCWCFSSICNAMAASSLTGTSLSECSKLRIESITCRSLTASLYCSSLKLWITQHAWHVTSTICRQTFRGYHGLLDCSSAFLAQWFHFTFVLPVVFSTFSFLNRFPLQLFFSSSLLSTPIFPIIGCFFLLNQPHYHRFFLFFSFLFT